MDEVFSAVVGSEKGLSSKEAERRLSAGGRNQWKEGKKRGPIRLFFAQFRDLMTVILIAAACLSAALAFYTGERGEIADTGILLFIVVLNAVVGAFQQYRADAALAKLKEMSAGTAKTVRDGKLVRIPAEELVVGDVIELEEGDRVPADCRILTANDLCCDESALTGESSPVRKCDCIVRSKSLSERRNTLYSGTFCVRGNARCIVTATGMATEMGHIAALLGDGERPTPLDKTIAKLGKIVTAVVLAVAAVLFLGGMLAGRAGFLDNVMRAVAVAVAAIPEGMGAVVTVILAMGVRRMASSRAVMRKLSAVETLGSCSVICSDKTGTLTKNKMTVEEIATDFSLPSEQYSGTDVQRRLVLCMRVCHTVKGEAGSYVGDPTEIALVEFADRAGCTFSGKIVGMTPFRSERKRMDVQVLCGGKSTLYEKGGLEAVLPLCRTDAFGKPLSAEDRRIIQKRAAAFSASAMRVLAFAEGEREGNLSFLGLAAMRDPPKEGAAEAVASCQRAGIKTVMITGDSPETAYAIASRLGIASGRGEVITGEEIDALGADYAARAQEYSVYARVSPRHKSEIVRALQQKGEVVAMTGDGVNDAPALKAADIGVAMGSGTDVTRNASDMVITDDDFSTVVRAVAEGRNVFFNIKKTISFFLSTNFAEVLCVLLASLFLWQYDFLTSTQLLWINLITDSLPVLALGVEKTEGVMERPPVSDREIFSPSRLLRMAFYGAVQAAVTMGLFVYGVFHWGNAEAVTAAFITMSLLELLHAFNVRMEDCPHRFRDHFSNKTLLATAAAGLAANLLLVLVPPLRTAFSLAPLSPAQLTLALLAAFSILPLGALFRAFGKNFPPRLMQKAYFVPKNKWHHKI